MHVHLVVQSPSIFLISQIVRHAKAYVIANDHVHALLSLNVWQRLHKYVKSRFAFRVKRVLTEWHYVNVLRYMVRHEGVISVLDNDKLKELIANAVSEAIKKAMNEIAKSDKTTQQTQAQQSRQSTLIEFQSKYATFRLRHDDKRQVVWIELRQGKNRVSTGLTYDEYNALIKTLQSAKRSFGIKSGRKIRRVEGFEKALK